MHAAGGQRLNVTCTLLKKKKQSVKFIPVKEWKDERVNG
jgi:hypothetical protein